MPMLHVLAPRPGAPAAAVIDAGSGIVMDMAAWVMRGDPAIVYFEGNRYDVPNLRSFEERVRHAADRLVERYPTIARACFPRDQFDVIGTYVFEAGCRHRTLDITDQEALDAWCR